jgi:hypothetical protein
MNKKLFGVFAITFIIFSLGMISACGGSNNKCPKQPLTDVNGTIYQGNLKDVVSGANVQVTCTQVIVTKQCKLVGTGKNKKLQCTPITTTKDHTENTVSNSKGNYSVSFSQAECSLGDKVTVIATAKNLMGTAAGSITNKDYLGCLNMDLGIVNVPMVPEFGYLAGSLTILGSVGIFFVVRKK